MATQVILLERIEKLGAMGEIVNVKPGFARNYLIPQGLAALASSRNIKMMEHNLKKIQKQIDAAKEEASKVAARLAEISVTIAKPVGEQEKLYGSVNTRDIAASTEQPTSRHATSHRSRSWH